MKPTTVSLEVGILIRIGSNEPTEIGTTTLTCDVRSTKDSIASIDLTNLNYDLSLALRQAADSLAVIHSEGDTR